LTRLQGRNQIFQPRLLYTLPSWTTCNLLAFIMVDTDRDRERSPKRRRSRSPETREFKHDGGGQSSARMRSPSYHARKDRDSRRDERGSNGDRDRRRDSGRDDRRSGRGEYSEKDREKERDNDRKRYEDTVKKEPGEDVGHAFT
jgi:hypothetical protein